MIITIRNSDNKIIYFNQGNIDNNPEYSEIDIPVDFAYECCRSRPLSNAWYDPNTSSIYFKESLEEVKKAKIEEIFEACRYEMSTRNYGLYSPTLKNVIDCREIDVMRIGAVLQQMENLHAPDDTPLEYICYDNSIQQITLAQMKQIHVELTNELSKMLFYKHELYRIINSYVDDNQESIDAVKNIKWMWPL